MFSIPIIIICLYAGGYIGQLLRNYDEFQALGSSTGMEATITLPDAAFHICLLSAVTFPHGPIGIGVCVGGFALLVFAIMRMGHGEHVTIDRDRNLAYSSKGTYGTSGFMTPEEMNSVLDLVPDIRKHNGTILGLLDKKIVCVPTESRMNRNVAVYGASGSMKSRAYARNMMLQCVKRGESIICTDPKSELYEDMAQYLKNSGYTVKVFNLVNPENSDSWNCLSEIEGQELMAQLFTDVIIKNTGSVKDDHFWDNSELNLLKALVLFVEQGYPPENKNIGEVYKLLSLSSEKELEALFNALPLEHPAKAPYSIFRQAAESVRGGIIIGLGSRLQVFQNKMIRNITSYNEIDLTLPGREKCAYFCITSDQDSTFDFLSSLFLSFLFIKLVRYADKNGDNGRLPVPVHLLADELANIGVIPDLTKKISTIRSRNFSMSVIFQNLAQMQNRYPYNQWQEIIGNCDVQLFLGCTDEVTAKFISDRTGEVTIGVSSQAKQLNTWRVSNYTPEYRETSSIGKRKLLTPDEVLRLPLEKALVIIRGHKVLKVDKYDYSLHPESKKLIPIKASQHVPEWLKQLKADEAAGTTPTKTTSPVGLPGRRAAPAAKTPRAPKTPKAPPILKPRDEEAPEPGENVEHSIDIISDMPKQPIPIETTKPVRMDKNSIMS